MMILQKGNLNPKETKPKKSTQKYQLERQLTEKNYQLKQPTTQPTQPTYSKPEAKIENFQRETSIPTNPTWNNKPTRKTTNCKKTTNSKTDNPTNPTNQLKTWCQNWKFSKRNFNPNQPNQPTQNNKPTRKTTNLKKTTTNSKNQQPNQPNQPTENMTQKLTIFKEKLQPQPTQPTNLKQQTN